MGSPRLFNTPFALKELLRREEALELAKNLSGLSKEARALYEHRLEQMGISVAKLQRAIDTGGARGQVGSKREFTSLMVNPNHTPYARWPGQDFNWSLQEPHHGGSGLAGLEALGDLPPAKQHAVLQELAAGGRFPGQQPGKGMYSLIPGLHQQNPRQSGRVWQTPLEIGSRGWSAHGKPEVKLQLNPNDSVEELVKKISTHMDEFDVVNDAKLKESNRILRVIQALPEDQQVRALRDTLDDPKGLSKLYEFGGGVQKTTVIGTGKGGTTYFHSTSNDGTNNVFEYDPKKAGKGAWKWVKPAAISAIAAGAFSALPGQASAEQLKETGFSPEFILSYGTEQLSGKGGAFAMAKMFGNKGAQKFLRRAALKIGGRVGAKYAGSLLAGPFAPAVMTAAAAKDVWDVTNILTDDVPNKALEASYKNTLGRVEPAQEIPESYGRTRVEMSNTATPMTAETRPLTGVEKWVTDPGNEIEYIGKQAQENLNWLKNLFIN